jgi:hypothetical protein
MTHPRKQKVLDIFGREPATMDELAQCVIAVANEYREYRRDREGNLTAGPKAKVVGFQWQITHSDSVSNSHSNPVEGVSNFSRHKDKPTGYPGWNGRVWIRYASDEGYGFGNDALRQTLTHTGTGGYGGYSGPWEQVMSARFRRYQRQYGPKTYPDIKAYSWDYRLYDMDWPLITELYEKELMWGILADRAVYNPTHRFLWEDPDTKLADAKFLADFAMWQAKQTA